MERAQEGAKPETILDAALTLEAHRGSIPALHFRNLLEAMPVAAYTCDAEGLITYFNPRAAALWGRSPRLNDPADRYGGAYRLFSKDGEPLDHERSWMAVALHTHREISGEEIVIQRPDGTLVTALANAKPILDEEGRVVGALNVLIDIEERKRSEETTRFLADASAVLAEVADYERTLERIASLAVPSFADWFGVHVFQPDGSIRRLAVRHLDPRKERAVEAMYRAYPPTQGQPYGAIQVLRTGQPIFAVDFEAMLPRVARDDRHLQMLRDIGLSSFICVPMLSRGNIVGALTFATAESGRRYSELHLHAAQELASRAAIAIENAQLLEALREADRRKDEFLAMLAHELRNPLAPVRNAVQILRARGAGASEAQWAHDVIDRQVQQMSRLVDDLLDVSRIARGKIDLRRETVTLGAAVANAVEACRPAMERARHELTVSVPAEPIYVEADIARLSQVFSNLLTNAAKYTDPGGRIRVEASRDATHAIVHVSDNGIGIPPHMLHRVFDMFVQVERAGDHSQGGLGIGLTLVKRLVELHGGEVEARSPGTGQGSEFVVRLPLRDVERARPDAEIRPAAGEATGELKSRRILVVDDNKDAADSLAFLLRARGAEVRIAYDGLEAVGAAIAFVPDVVLLDVGLPKLYGYDAARRIRDARGNSVLIVAITGWGQEEDRRRAQEAGFDHHFTKPVDFAALMSLITKAR